MVPADLKILIADAKRSSGTHVQRRGQARAQKRLRTTLYNIAPELTTLWEAARAWQSARSLGHGRSAAEFALLDAIDGVDKAAREQCKERE